MLSSLISDTKSSVQFLSRIPLLLVSEELPDFQKTAHTFPLAGLIISLPAAALLWGASSLNLPATVCALLAVTALFLTTGGLHEDGLADVADGFGGGHNRERKLEIMRDSAVGTYGVVSLVLSIGLKVALLTHLLTLYNGGTVALILVAVTAVSRLAMLQPWAALSPARQEAEAPVKNKVALPKEKETSGLSNRYGSPDNKTVSLGLLCSLPAALILLFTVGPWAVALSLVTAGVFIIIFTSICEKQIGGHTGDTLGATQQLSELGLLLGLATIY
ncbi:MAG: adenosylcobinamide-GDP ribazoletransferase [Rhizobiaceae bacterium]